MLSLTSHQNCWSLSVIFTRFGIVAFAVFVAALIGIWTRPVSFFAFFWPANALLLGLFLRFPNLNKIEGWLGAVIGFFAADCLTGNNLLLTVGLTFANLTNIFVALILFHRFRLNYKEYNQGLTFFYILVLLVISSAIGAFVAINTVPYLPNTYMHTEYLLYEFILWWTGELQNLILFLPIVLAFPELKKITTHKCLNLNILTWHNIIPLIFVIFSTTLTTFFFGPGTLSLPTAALILAALRYNFFSLTIINFLVSFALFYNLSRFSIELSSLQFSAITVATRVGVLMLIISSLTVCLVSTNRRFLFKEILFLVEHDSLTKTMSRHHFMESTQQLLSQNKQKVKHVSLLMLDIDYFKKINDRYGHLVGDQALQHFVQATQRILTPQTLFGRIGGEEFAILLKDTPLKDAEKTAQDIQKALIATPMPLANGENLTIELSIGLAFVEDLRDIHHIDYFIHYADQALYQAKRSGRNRICVSHINNQIMH